jgi:tagatose-6-phosphate ketose/aldose isomerase|nr:tagatose-6-phosphate ketose isomerase [Rhodanobacter glycinis]
MSNLGNETKGFISARDLLAATPEMQQRYGYADTLREIRQQPETWLGTAELIRSTHVRELLRNVLSPQPTHIVLTGSGSSMYAGECLAPNLQSGLGLPVQSIASGTLLTHWSSVLPPGPGLLISLARSGDSPESCGVVSRLLADAPKYRHLVITCNASGKLATSYAGDPRVSVLTLNERTNDRSLVMTSSFTNLVLAGTGLLTQSDSDVQATARFADAVQRILDDHAQALAALAVEAFSNIVYLGSGGALGAAHESALKMLEMTDGDVVTVAETYLGLRHGPMSSLNERTLIVGFLSSDPLVRAYEIDLLRELKRKQLGIKQVLVGQDIPRDVLGAHDIAVLLPSMHTNDSVLPLLADVVVGQMLAFFRCIASGGRPDTPSQGVLTRVVGDFPMHQG